MVAGASCASLLPEAASQGRACYGGNLQSFVICLLLAKQCKVTEASVRTSLVTWPWLISWTARELD